MDTLYEARVKKRKKQSDMAKTIGKSIPFYRNIEKNPHLASIQQADKISQYLGVTMSEINWRERLQ